jgi:hypothetical protein
MLAVGVMRIRPLLSQTGAGIEMVYFTGGSIATSLSE